MYVPKSLDQAFCGIGIACQRVPRNGKLISGSQSLPACEISHFGQYVDLPEARRSCAHREQAEIEPMLDLETRTPARWIQNSNC